MPFTEGFIQAITAQPAKIHAQVAIFRRQAALADRIYKPIIFMKKNRRVLIMGKQVKHMVNVVLAAIGLAMGVAVIVMTAINADVTTNELIKLLAIAVTSLGIFALGNIHKFVT